MRRWSCWYVLLALGLASLVGCGSSSGGPGPGPSDGGRLQGNLGPENAGAVVSLDGTELEATVSPDGSFVLENVPPGEYTMAVEGGGYEGGAVLCRVVEGETTEVGEVPVAMGGRITGVVTIASRQEGPIEGARVTLRLTQEIWLYGGAAPPGMLDDITNAGGSEGATPPPGEPGDDGESINYPPRTVLTDVNGEFDVNGLPSGPYLVSIEADGYESTETATWVSPGMTSPVDAQLVFIDPNNATVNGRVTTVENGETVPLAYVVVDLWPTDLGFLAGRSRQDDGGGDGGNEGGDGGSEGGEGGDGQTDDGNGGEEVLTADGGGEGGNGDGGDGQTDDGAGGGGEEQVNLEDGGGEMPPNAGGGMGDDYGYGFEDGAGAPGRPMPDDIDPWCLPPWRWGKQAMTDENGEFSIANVEPGEYVVNIWRFGYTPVQEVITLTERDVETLNKTLESLLTTVSGTVFGRTEGGDLEPLAGAFVSGYAMVWDPWVDPAEDGKEDGSRQAPGEPTIGWAETDAEGRYEITLEAGRVWVEAWKEGYAPSGTDFSVTMDGATGVDLILEPDGSGGGDGGDDPVRPMM